MCPSQAKLVISALKTREKKLEKKKAFMTRTQSDYIKTISQMSGKDLCVGGSRCSGGEEPASAHSPVDASNQPILRQIWPASGLDDSFTSCLHVVMWQTRLRNEVQSNEVQSKQIADRVKTL